MTIYRETDRIGAWQRGVAENKTPSRKEEMLFDREKTLAAGFTDQDFDALRVLDAMIREEESRQKSLLAAQSAAETYLYATNRYGDLNESDQHEIAQRFIRDAGLLVAESKRRVEALERKLEAEPAYSVAAPDPMRNLFPNEEQESLDDE